MTIVHSLHLIAFTTVAVIASSSARAQAIPSVTPAREVVVDGIRHHLVPIGFVRVDTAGRIFVGQGQDYSIRVFAADGRPLLRLGQRGSGPGEFQSQNLFRAGFVGDSLWVAEFGRLQILSPGGKSILNASVRLRRNQTLSGFTAATYGLGTVEAVFAKRELLVSTLGSPTGESDPLAFSFLYARADRDGRLTRLVAIDPRGRTSPASSKSPRSAVAVAPDGSHIVIATQQPESLLSIRIVELTAMGDTVFSRPLPGFTRPEVQNALSGAFVARNGAVLVTLVAEGETRQAVILSPSGAPVMLVSFRRATSVRQFDGDVIWATDGDREGVESVVRYRIGARPR